MSIDIRERLNAIMSEWVTDDDERAAVLAGQPFKQAMNVDSMAFLQLVIKLETSFDVTIDAGDIEEMFESLVSLESGLAKLITS